MAEMKRYQDLSRAGKMKVDLARRKAVKDAQEVADKGDSFGRKADDFAAKLLLASPLNTNSARDIGEVNADAARRERKRQDALQDAKSKANYDDVRREDSGSMFGRYFQEATPTGYKKGGTVRATGFRGYGKAKKV